MYKWAQLSAVIMKVIELDIVQGPQDQLIQYDPAWGPYELRLFYFKARWYPKTGSFHKPEVFFLSFCPVWTLNKVGWASFLHMITFFVVVTLLCTCGWWAELDQDVVWFITSSLGSFRAATELICLISNQSSVCVSSLQMPVAVGPYGQTQPSCFDRVKMGFMMGFAVGMAAGAMFGTFSCLR